MEPTQDQLDSFLTKLRAADWNYQFAEGSDYRRGAMAMEVLENRAKHHQIFWDAFTAFRKGRSHGEAWVAEYLASQESEPIQEPDLAEQLFEASDDSYGLPTDDMPHALLDISVADAEPKPEAEPEPEPEPEPEHDVSPLALAVQQLGKQRDAFREALRAMAEGNEKDYRVYVDLARLTLQDFAAID